MSIIEAWPSTKLVIRVPISNSLAMFPLAPFAAQPVSAQVRLYSASSVIESVYANSALSLDERAALIES